MTAICRFFDKKPQAYYKRLTAQIKAFLDEQLIIAQVKNIRRKQPRVGTRKLQVDLKNLGFKIGRDRLFDMLSKYDMLIKPKKRNTRTTKSNHWFKKYTNLIKGVELNAPNQVFVADITYLRLNNGFAYLSLITDAFSRKIVGWDISTSLCVSGALRALNKALKDVPHPEGLIHHSDRGIQYCCKDYVNLLNDNHVLISMTEENHCYENALAERVNGILKDEFFLDQIFQSLTVVKELVQQSIQTYNYYRRHMSLDYKIPAEVHNAYN